MEKQSRFKKWELALMIIGALVFSGAGYLLFTDTPIKLSWFGIDGAGDLKKIAIIENTTGTFKRKTTNDPAFREIQVSSDLFNRDTVVTGPSVQSKITFDDGSFLELQENTMMILTFESELSLSGVSRVPKIQVLSGNVTGTAKSGKLIIKSDQGEIDIAAGNKQTVAAAAKVPPIEEAKAPPAEKQPEVNPTEPPKEQQFATIQILTPQDKTVLKIPDGSAEAEYMLDLSWKVTPAVPLELEFVKKTGGEIKSLAKKVITPGVDGVGSLKAKLKSPGLYGWKLKQTEETMKDYKIEPTDNEFALSPTFTAIDILPPIYAGREIASNQYDKKLIKDFDLKLRWIPWSDAEDYRVKIMTSAKGGKVVAQKSVSAPEFQLNRGKLLSKAYYYQVSTKTENGFEVVSDVVPVQFSFLPPKPVYPQAGHEVSLANPASKKALLFTWTKTNFTENYVFELSRDPGFAQIAFQKQTPENFLSLKTPSTQGAYYWRVKSIGQGNIQSDTSDTRKFEIKP